LLYFFLKSIFFLEFLLLFILFFLEENLSFFLDFLVLELLLRLVLLPPPALLLTRFTRGFGVTLLRSVSAFSSCSTFPRLKVPLSLRSSCADFEACKSISILPHLQVVVSGLLPPAGASLIIGKLKSPATKTFFARFLSFSSLIIALRALISASFFFQSSPAALVVLFK